MEDEHEFQTEEPLPLTVIHDLESERKENIHFAAEFLRCGREIEKLVNDPPQQCALRDFVESEVPTFVSLLVDTKMVIYPALEDQDQETLQKYEQFERHKMLEFEEKHKERMRGVSKENVSGIRDLYSAYVVAFQQKQAELDLDQESSENESEDTQDKDIGFSMQSSTGCCDNHVNAYNPMSGAASYLY